MKDTTTRDGGPDVLEQRLERHPAASIRRERFGALVYHQHNRRLLFLKDHSLVAVVEALGDYPDVRSALAACSVAEQQHQAFASALIRLVRSEVVRARAD